MSGPPSLEGLGAPAGVVAAIGRLHEELAGAAGANLAGLILSGGLARGRYRPGRSDVNVVVLLHDATAASLAPLAPPLQAAWRAVRIVQLIGTFILERTLGRLRPRSSSLVSRFPKKGLRYSPGIFAYQGTGGKRVLGFEPVLRVRVSSFSGHILHLGSYTTLGHLKPKTHSVLSQVFENRSRRQQIPLPQLLRGQGRFKTREKPDDD